MDTKCVCGSRLYEHTVLVPQCVPSKSYVYLCYLTISRPFISQAATPTVPVAPTATAIVTPPATVVSGIISTSSRQHAITSGSTRAPAITEFRIPQTVKGNVAKKRKASAQHCLPQHRGACSTAPIPECVRSYFNQRGQASCACLPSYCESVSCDNLCFIKFSNNPDITSPPAALVLAHLLPFTSFALIRYLMSLTFFSLWVSHSASQLNTPVTPIRFGKTSTARCATLLSARDCTSMTLTGRPILQAALGALLHASERPTAMEQYKFTVQQKVVATMFNIALLKRFALRLPNHCQSG